MQQSKFLQTLFILFAGFSGILTTLGALFKIMHWPYADILLISGMISICLIIVISLIDLSIANLHQKWAWIIGFLISPLGVALVYFTNKKDLIKLKELKDKGELE